MPGKQTHRLEIGRGRAAVVSLTFESGFILAAVEIPSGLKPKIGRRVQAWAADIFRKLDGDARELRIVATQNGRVVSIGSELNGSGCIVFSHE